MAGGQRRGEGSPGSSCGASCILHAAVSLNTSESNCTHVLASGESFELDTWGSVRLTPGGVVVHMFNETAEAAEANDLCWYLLACLFASLLVCLFARLLICW